MPRDTQKSKLYKVSHKLRRLEDQFQVTCTAGTFSCEWLCASNCAALDTSTLAPKCFNSTGSAHRALETALLTKFFPPIINFLLMTHWSEQILVKSTLLISHHTRQLYFISILDSFISRTVCGRVVFVSLTERTRKPQTAKYPRAWLWFFTERANALAPVQVCAAND